MRILNVLIACEESQTICKAFRDLGHNAFSCDLQEPSGDLPQYHILGDVTPLLEGSKDFTTMNGESHHINKWDLIICHPECTYLTVSGNRWFNIERYGDKARERYKKREEAAEFFMKCVNANCEHIAIENPIGYMNTHYRKADQVIEPFQFGHKVCKKTCLWLKNLPLLVPTNIVEPERVKCADGKWYSGPALHAVDENGKILAYNDPRTAKIRSKTYEGIAKAIASQWSEYLLTGDNTAASEVAKHGQKRLF